MSNDSIKVDEDKLANMIYRICKLEVNNAKTGSILEKDMRSQIEKIIEEIAADEVDE